MWVAELQRLLKNQFELLKGKRLQYFVCEFVALRLDQKLWSRDLRNFQYPRFLFSQTRSKLVSFTNTVKPFYNELVIPEDVVCYNRILLSKDQKLRSRDLQNLQYPKFLLFLQTRPKPASFTNTVKPFYN